jgi:tripartite-type tricarboxylate transporter receptor subunit TctC
MTVPVPAFAQVRDNRIMIIVGAASGGALDKVARLVAKRWSEQGGVPVVVDNKAGANGMIAMAAVAKSQPDGHTIVFGPGASAAPTRNTGAGPAASAWRGMTRCMCASLRAACLVSARTNSPSC